MEDDHVDRPGVEAQQCVKLTGTNSSIGLIVLIVHAHQGDRIAFVPVKRSGKRTAFVRFKPKDVFTKQDKRRLRLLPASQLIALSRPGGYGGVAAPVPIPNTAVKRPSANGTSSQDAGE